MYSNVLFGGIFRLHITICQQQCSRSLIWKHGGGTTCQRNSHKKCKYIFSPQQSVKIEQNYRHLSLFHKPAAAHYSTSCNSAHSKLFRSLFSPCLLPPRPFQPCKFMINRSSRVWPSAATNHRRWSFIISEAFNNFSHWKMKCDLVINWCGLLAHIKGWPGTIRIYW